MKKLHPVRERARALAKVTREAANILSEENPESFPSVYLALVHSEIWQEYASSVPTEELQADKLALAFCIGYSVKQRVLSALAETNRRGN